MREIESSLQRMRKPAGAAADAEAAEADEGALKSL